MPKVSVIVPTYNRAEYLKLVVESILSQEYDDYEIIITDNCSTDNTSDIIKAIDSKKVRYYRNEKNLGMAGNYNAALNLATGEYIHVFSDDDIMLPGCLKKKVDVLDSYPEVGLVHSDISIIDGDGNVTSNDHWGVLAWKKWSAIHNDDKIFSGKEYHKLLFKIHNLICMPSVMFRKSLLEVIGRFDENLNFIIDWDYWLKLTLFADVYYLKTKTILYRIHNKSTTSKVDNILDFERKYIKKSLFVNFSNEAVIRDNAVINILQQSSFYAHYNYLKVLKFALKIFLKGFSKNG